MDRLTIGYIGENYAKSAFARAGYSVFVPEIDDRAIDLILRRQTPEPEFLEIQVKTLRADAASPYFFIRKKHFPLTDNRYVALVLLAQTSEPTLYLLPARLWHNPHSPFSANDYPGRKSEPEYGFSLTRQATELIKPYRFGEPQKPSPEHDIRQSVYTASGNRIGAY